MVWFAIHTLFICFIAFVLLSIIHVHERDPRMMRLLTFLVVAAGGAAIVHRLLVLYGIDF